jgi:F-type H+-transporting ATPase subunit b
VIDIVNLLGADAPNGKHLPPDINEVWWGTAAFFIVVGLLAWKVLPLVKNMMNERSEKIAGELNAAETTRRGAEEERDRLVGSLGDIGAEREQILSDARTQAATMKEELIARADSDAAALRAQVGTDMAASQAQASADLTSEMSSLTLRSAEAVVDNSLDDTTQRDLIESYINQVGSSN